MGVRIEIDLDLLRLELEGPAAQAEMDRIVTVLAENADEKTPARSGDRRKVTTKTGKRVYPKAMKGGYKWSRPSPGVRRLYHRSRLFHMVEFGSAYNPVYAPIRRGVSEAGLQIRVDPKR